MRSANELVTTSLAPYPDDLVIATKVVPRSRAEACVQNQYGLTPGRTNVAAAGLRLSEEDLRQLDTNE